MDKVERVARALCVVDGKDPEERVWTGQIGDVEPERPLNWHRYRDEARRFVAAFDALGGTITSGG